MRMARSITSAVLAAALLSCAHARASGGDPSPAEVSYCAPRSEQRAPYYLKRTGWRNPNPLATTPWIPPREAGVGPSPRSRASRPEAIRDEIRTHGDEVRACAAGLPPDGGAPPGRVTLRWNVLGDGSVAEICVVREETTIREPVVLRCVASAVMGWRLESARPADPEKITVVSYPWTLRARRAEGPESRAEPQSSPSPELQTDQEPLR